MSETTTPITTGTAAKILGLSADRVRQLEQTGKLPAQRTDSGVRLFDRARVEALARVREARGQ